MPKVDVIIPAYNAARFLPLAIESVIGQTFTDWRILLVDDGSTDGTAEVVAPFLERLGEKMEYLPQANGGPSAARNTAIRRSSAEFLALLDGDDIWLPERLAESLKVFEGRPEVGLAHGYISRIDPEGNVIDILTRPQRYAEGWIAPYIYMRKVNLPAPTITFRRECVEAVGMFDESLRATEDRDLWLRIAQRYKVALVPKVVALYRTSPGSATTDMDRMLRAQMSFIEKNYGSPGCGWLARRVAMSQAYKQRAEALALRTQSWPALKNSLRALTLYPLDKGSARTSVSLLMRCLGLYR